MTLLYLVGEADDIVGVGYRYKFLVQAISAGLIVISGTWMHSFAGLFGIGEVPAWIGIPATILIIIFITNAINLIDGIDGLASGLSIISLITLTALLMTSSSYIYILLAVATLGIVLVFWFYNVFGNARKLGLDRTASDSQDGCDNSTPPVILSGSEESDNQKQ